MLVNKAGPVLFRGCAVVALLSSQALNAVELEKIDADYKSGSQRTINQAEKKSSTSILLEEIVVTAQRRSQGAQSVGISITAFTGEQINRFGLNNAQEVAAFAPGVSTIQPNGESNYSLAIRGVANSDFNTNVESPVAVYVDETYISQTSGAGFLLFDLERVEILRGPQGTLFGRNATGGLAHYISVKPEQGEASGYGSISYERFNRIRLEGAYGFSLNDQWSARISASSHQGDGYVENRLRPDENLNNANEVAGRLQLLYQPNDSFNLLLNARFGQQDIRTGFFEFESAIFPTGQATPGVPNENLNNYVDLDGNVFAGDYDRPGRNDLETFGFTANASWDLPWATLTSISDFQSVERDYIEDSDASPVDFLSFFLTTDSEQFSQEFRLSGGTADLKWVTGFYYLNLDVNDSNGGIAPGFFESVLGASVADLGFNGQTNPYQSETRTWSLFAQLEYDISEDLTLIGGFRYISEERDFFYRNILTSFPDTAVSGADPNAIFVADALEPFTGNRNDTEWAGRLQLDYTPVDSLLLYASFNRGVKSGGFNAPLLPTASLVTDAFISYDPEILNAYEAGFKWDVIPGALRVNGAAYYYDYNNYQAFSFFGTDAFTLNAQAENQGFELEIQASPVTGLDLQLGIGYIDARVTDVPGLTVDVDTPLGPVDALIPGATVTPVQTPDWNLSGLVRYELYVGDYGALAFQVDGQYRSEHFFSLTGFDAVREDGYFVSNASVTWFPEDADWSLRVFAQNITDEEYLVQSFDLSGNLNNGGLFGLIQQYYGRPLQWGVNLRFSF